MPVEQLEMPIAPCAPSLNDVMRVVESIDLTMVKRKLMDPEEGQGWDADHTEYVEKRYRRFLCMIRLRVDASAVPTRDIDLFWHQHILDTRAYARDCELLFGKFLHHYPYFGMFGDEDARNLSTAFEETKRLYASLFGESYTEDDASSKCHKGCSKCHKCQSGCGMSCKQCKSS